MFNNPPAASDALNGNRLVDVRVVATKLQCDERTVYRLAEAGRMPFGLKLGALRRWSERDIDQWIANGCKPVRTAIGGNL